MSAGSAHSRRRGQAGRVSWLGPATDHGGGFGRPVVGSWRGPSHRSQARSSMAVCLEKVLAQARYRTTRWASKGEQLVNHACGCMPHAPGVGHMTGVCPRCRAKLANVEEAPLTTRARPEDPGVSAYLHLASICTNESCPGRHRKLADLLASGTAVKRLLISTP